MIANVLRIRLCFCLSLASLCGAFGAELNPSEHPLRRVAITFDDLPAVSLPAGTNCDLKALKDVTEKLLATIAAHAIPTVGFVNEGRICNSLGPEALPELLNMWLDRGSELGNHTFSHVDIDVTTVASYEADIVRGEATVKKLLNERGKALRYFRYPFLNTGRDEDTKTAIESFLSDHGYTSAPVTISSNEWIFAAAYADAKERRDLDTLAQIADAYIPYMQKVFDYFEKASVKIFGRETSQILLIHASALNADCLEALIAMLRSRGYAFVSLEEALKDPAYCAPDTYLGSDGFSWLLRWAQTKGIHMRPRPLEPTFVRMLYNNTLAH
jgi:peptidoglycan/xylan/chitin deacetylase (PgdA/CDA1 family)